MFKFGLNMIKQSSNCLKLKLKKILLSIFMVKVCSKSTNNMSLFHSDTLNVRYLTLDNHISPNSMGGWGGVKYTMQPLL